MADADAPSTLTRFLGEHLRRLRKQKGLSLQEVESLSDKEFKSSVLGAYERGERAVSAPRLARLAEIYGLPLQAMLPPDERGVDGQAPSGVALDIGKLEAAEGEEAKVVARYVRSLQGLRQDWTSRVMRIRSDDVRALAAVLDRTPAELVKVLTDLGVRAY